MSATRRGCRLAASLAITVSLAGAPAGAAQLARPDVSFGASPTFTPRINPSLFKPTITGYGTTGCVQVGGPVTIVGRNFGTAAGKGVVLGGHGIRIDLPVTSWSNTQIVAAVPKDPRIALKQSYYIGVEKADHSAWLSNTDKNITTCATSSPLRTGTLTLKPSPTRLSTGGFVPGPRVSLSPPGGGEAPPPAEASSPSEQGAGSTYQAAPSGGGGSLLARGLPPPPPAPPPAPQAVHKDAPNVEPGEVVVLSSNLREAQALAQQAGALGYSVKRRRILKGLGLVISVLRLPAGTPVMQALQTLRAAAPKVWMDANHRYRLEGGASAKSYGRRLVGWGAVGASCGAGRRIGLVDTAIDLHQPALRGEALTVHRVLSSGVPLAPADHGTAIAALLVGRPRPAVTAGLVPGAHLYAAVVFRRRGKHLDTTAEDVVAALDWLVRHHVQVINLSLGGPRNLILEAAVQRVEALGIVVVAAAGNGGPKAAPVYPAAQKGVVAVTAVDARLRPYEDANRGAYIALAAPGVDVWVARAGGGGAFVSGTSYAAPFVTAAIARQAGRAGPAVRALERHARDLGKPGRDPVFGWGLVRVKGRCGH